MRCFPLFAALSLMASTGFSDGALDGLEATASSFVAAYNEKEADKIAELFTEEGEMVDEINGTLFSGHEEISANFATLFTAAPDRKMSLDVSTVRIVGEGVAIEDGFIYFTEGDSEEVTDGVAYTATLMKNEEGTWQIASTRQLEPVDFDGPPLHGLSWLVGEWFFQEEQVLMDISFDWSRDGAYILGDAVTTTSDGDPMTTEIRIGYDAAHEKVRWWTFDDAGGFSKGVWNEVEDGWLVKTSGVTADGETTSAVQKLTYDGETTIRWESTYRFLNDEPLSDVLMHIVKRPPAPSLTKASAE